MQSNGRGVRHDASTVTDTTTDSYYDSLTVKSLRKDLKKRGLQMQGRKAELVARLKDSDRAMNEGTAARERRKHTVATAAATASINGSTKSTTSTLQHAVKNGSSSSSSSSPAKSAMSLQKERGSLVLWKRPLVTFYYFLLEIVALLHNYGIRLWHNKKLVTVLLLTFLAFFTAYHTDGPHQHFVMSFRKHFLWCSYWVGLGILSSVGLGTGLHTFLLYLGPHIAAVTLAAFECMSVDFPTPPYPDDIICPEEEGVSMSIWRIMSKVRLEAFMWGAGTAIGELPPYFMARAARLSGQIDEEEQEIEELVHEKHTHPSELSFLDRAKVAVHDLVQRVGFAGILLCASIPNPLFDLAGITCGHFLVPFWTFFGATLIGKAVIKMHIQKLFVIFVFSERHVEQVISLIKYIPFCGQSMQVPFKEYLQKQKLKLHHKPGTSIPGESSWLSWIFEKIVMVMVVYFVISIINSMAQSYHKRLTQKDKIDKTNQE